MRQPVRETFRIAELEGFDAKIALAGWNLYAPTALRPGETIERRLHLERQKMFQSFSEVPAYHRVWLALNSSEKPAAVAMSRSLVERHLLDEELITRLTVQHVDWKKTVFFYNLYVHPAYEGRKLTPALIQARQRHAAEEGFTHHVALVAEDNSAGLRWYQRHGEPLGSILIGGERQQAFVVPFVKE